MRASFLLALLLAVPTGAGLAQEATAKVDTALVQRYIDGDTAARGQIARTFTDQTVTPFGGAIMGVGNEAARQGRPKDAIRAFEAALELSAGFSSPRAEIVAMNGLGMIYGQTGEYSAGVRYLTGALEKATKATDPDLVSAVSTNLANIYRRRGQFELALAMYSRALATFEAAKNDASIARVLNNIGAVNQEQGNFREAIDYYLRSLAIKEKLDGSADDVIVTLGNIGGVYALQGNEPQAIEYLERAVTMAERLNSGRALIVMNANLGRVLMDAGRYAESEARLTRALELAEKASYTDMIAGSLNALANVAIKRQQWTRAAGHLDRAKLLFEKIGDPINSGQVLLSQASIAIEQGRNEEGIVVAQQARDAFAAVGRPTALLDAEVLLGEGLSNLRRWPDAIATYKRAIEITERGLDVVAGDAEDRFRYLEGTSNAYFGLAHAYAASGRAADALGAAERGRARMLLDMLASGSADDELLTPEERDRRVEVEAELSALNRRIATERARARNGVLDPTLAAARERARQARDEFYLGLDAKHPRLGFARGHAPVLSAREIAGALPPKSGLIEFVSGTRGTWIMLLVPRAGGEPRLTVKPVPLTTTRLRELTGEFTRQVATRDLSFSANARAVYDALLGPIESELAAVDQLIIVPHGTLWEVPFQALQTPRQKFLVEEHAIAYAPSASALKALKDRSRPRRAQPRVIAFGDPRLNDPKVAPLPNAAREANAIGAVYGATAIVATNAEATEPRFRQLAPKADIVHIATHGILDDASPLFSYVMLSGGANGRGADGRLEGRDLINMQLDAELVVLSACETARGRIANGEGVVGLSWALFAAGAATTTVSLWPVDSASTTELMSAFHRGRRQLVDIKAPAPTSQALRAAQQQALANPESRHPFYWAGFVVIGVP